MTIIAEAMTENAILAAVQSDATIEAVREALTTQGAACVNHLCGCSAA